MTEDITALVGRLRTDAHVPGVAPATALQAADALVALEAENAEATNERDDYRKLWLGAEDRREVQQDRAEAAEAKITAALAWLDATDDLDRKSRKGYEIAIRNAVRALSDTPPTDQQTRDGSDS